MHRCAWASSTTIARAQIMRLVLAATFVGLTMFATFRRLRHGSARPQIVSRAARDGASPEMLRGTRREAAWSCRPWPRGWCTVTHQKPADSVSRLDFLRRHRAGGPTALSIASVIGCPICRTTMRWSRLSVATKSSESAFFSLRQMQPRRHQSYSVSSIDYAANMRLTQQRRQRSATTVLLPNGLASEHSGGL